MNRHRHNDPDDYDGTPERRRDVMPGAPWWARLLVVSGIPPVFIVLGLLAVGLGWVRVPGITPTNNHVITKDFVQQLFIANSKQHEELLRRLTTALEIMCENAAVTIAQLNNCRNIR